MTMGRSHTPNPDASVDYDARSGTRCDWIT